MNQLKLFTVLKKHDLSFNEYTVLLNCYLSKKPLPDLQNPKLFSKFVTLSLLNSDYTLNKKCLDIIYSVESLFKKKDARKEILIDKEILEEYREMWPNIKLPSGVYARVNVKNLEANFKWFFKNYDYSWETILSATALYLNEYSDNNYKFMRNSLYFVKKTGLDKMCESQLATYCDRFLETGDMHDEVDDIFKTKVV
jgi:hypothetical protein